MEERQRSRFDARGLVLAGGPEPLAVDFFTAEIHYWRLDRSAWRACLAAIKSLGFEIVSTYVPWSVHERAPGRFDWSGHKDLAAFLDEVAAAGLYAVVKPGPHINAELTGFGFPERVVRDPAMQARSARDTPVWMPAPPRMFPVPSYASTAFRAAAGEWLAAVGEVVAPRRFPDGAVVAVQVDNEMQMFFRLGAFDHDYHPDALVWWRDEVGEIEAPRAFDPADPGRMADWQRFKDRYAARALAWVKDAMVAAGMGGLARYHNAPPTEPWHVDLPAMAAAVDGPAGLDVYLRADAYRDVRRRGLYLAGTAQPLPMAPEVGVGGPPWLPPMSPTDQASVTLGLLAAGVRAMSFFMVVDRDRWYGAPITTTGTVRAPGPWLETLLATLRQVEWTRLRRHAPVALVASRCDARLSTAASLVDPLSPVVAELLRLGPGGAGNLSRDPAFARLRRWYDAVTAALDLAGVPYVWIDEEVPAERLGEFAAIIAPTLDRVDRGLWRRLHAAAAAGVTVVVGPERPRRDERDEALGDDAALPRPCGLLKADSLGDLDGLADDLAALAGELPVDFTSEDLTIDCARFDDPSGNPRVVFVGHDRAETTDVALDLPAGSHLVDPFGGEVTVRRGRAHLRLGPHEVRMLRVE